MQDNIAPIVTAFSLVIGAVATVIIALKKTKDTDSGNKAISVTRIDDTDRKVETLINQVDFLFQEIGKLRLEKEELVKEVARLRVELALEKTDHTETKRLLANALLELADKNARILALEGAQGILIKEK